MRLPRASWAARNSAWDRSRSVMGNRSAEHPANFRLQWHDSIPSPAFRRLEAGRRGVVNSYRYLRLSFQKARALANPQTGVFPAT
jgi:hypothetical protein